MLSLSLSKLGLIFLVLHAGMPMPHAVGVVEVILLILSSSVAHGAWLLAACAGMSAGRGYGNEECQDCAPRLFY